MKGSIISLFLVLALTTTACATPMARALEAASTPTPYWSFLWPSQTAWPMSQTAAATVTASASTSFPAGTSGPSEAPAAATDWHVDSPATPIPLISAAAAPTFTATTTAKLRATVTVGFLSCRYGPGANYLYLYALRKGANITLIGRTDADNWHWAWVEGKNRCWVNTSYLQVEGDWHQLPVVYPGVARLPISPYYPPTRIVSVVRTGNSVTVEWAPIPLRAGDEEDEFMQHYILEVWHCRGGQLIFEPLATNYTFLTVLDEPGCGAPSHARVFVQEKHGFSGPTEVPWRPAQ